MPRTFGMLVHCLVQEACSGVSHSTVCSSHLTLALLTASNPSLSATIGRECGALRPSRSANFAHRFDATADLFDGYGSTGKQSHTFASLQVGLVGLHCEDPKSTRDLHTRFAADAAPPARAVQHRPRVLANHRRLETPGASMIALHGSD